MIKLELKDVAAYIPYKPKCNVMGGCDDDGNAIAYKVTGCCINTTEQLVYISKDNNESDMALEDIFLLLHPMSDLTKEITVEGYNEGKAFLPLVEIAKIIETSAGNTNCVYEYVESEKYVSVYIDGEEWSLIEHDGVWFRHYHVPRKQIVGLEEEVLDILNLLNQWHFDYRNLIDKGLAIDINTLK